MATVPTVGETLGRYRIVEQIGRGGMGVVFRAFDEQLQRYVAIKFTNPSSDESGRRKFRNEALALARLNHPHIGVIHGFETVEGLDLLVMEYISGKTLTEHIAGKPLPEAEVVALGLQLAAALREAHASGVIHRDLKPGNIVVTADGDAKILDFGLALLRVGSSPTMSAVGLEGTLQYMAPEVLRGSMPDERSDLYSLGAILYEMATGRPPHANENFGQLVESVLHKAPVPPEQIVPGISASLAGIIKRSLETDPSHRYPTAGDLRADLQRLQSGTRLNFPIKLWPRRLWLRVTLALTIPVVALFLLWLGTKLPPALPQKRVVAVLPFDLIGGGPENRALSRGLTDLITVRLAQVSRRYKFEVVPSSEIRAQDITSAEQARQKLGASLVVEGSWDFTNQLRIMFALVDTQTKRSVKAAVVPANLTDIYTAENSVYQQVLGMLDVEVAHDGQPGSESEPAQPNAYQYYVRGRGYLWDYQDPQNVTRAIALFNTAIDSDKKFAPAYAGLGEAYWRRYEETKDPKWVEEAKASCTHAASLDPNLSNAHSTLGLISHGTGKDSEAVTSFEEALRLDPANDAASRGLAATYEALGNFPKAEVAYQQAIAVRPDYWGGYQALGVFYFRRGQLKEAEEQFKQVLHLAPDNVRGYTDLGGIYYYQNRFPEARKLFLASLKIQPNYRAYSNLATMDFFDRKYADAAGMFEQALKLDDKDYRLWRNMAWAYYWSGQRDKAKIAFERTANLIEQQRKVNPKDIPTMIALADCYSMMEQKDKAEAMLKQALAANPSDAESAFRATEIYEQLGNRDQALAWLQKAINRGYMISEIEKDPSLVELRKDPNYTSLVKSK